jgi:uncharacterized protein (TIGR02186 family)
MRHCKPVLLATFILVALAAVLARAADSSLPPMVKVTPQVVPMGTFYGGARVRVEGKVPPGSDVAIAIRGADVTEVFNKVGRVGPIWVNTGKVFISGIPSLLLIFSSKPLNNCLSRAEIDRYQLDADAIKKHIEVKPQQKDVDLVANDFLKLKVRQGSYQMPKDDIGLASPDEQGLPYTLEIVWPKSAPPGTYEVTVYACRGGEVKESLKVPLQVVEVGFPAMIASLARERPSTYGIISVVVAILAGFGIDFLATLLFKKKIRAH